MIPGRWLLRCGLCLGIAWPATCAHAQEQAQNQTDATPPHSEAQERAAEGIDIRAEFRASERDPLHEAQCKRDQDAARISNEIVVCAPVEENARYRIESREGAQTRYAEETAYANDPQAPNVAGKGIFRGPANIGGMCFVPPCPPPPALMIDLEALPEAPPGSDADRIARGLAPLGRSGAATPAPMPPRSSSSPQPSPVAGPAIDEGTPQDEVSQDEAPQNEMSQNGVSQEDTPNRAISNRAISAEPGGPR